MPIASLPDGECQAQIDHTNMILYVQSLHEVCGEAVIPQISKLFMFYHRFEFR